MFKTTKAKVIFVIIFSIICLAITTLLIVYQNIDIQETNKDVEEEISKEEVQKDVDGIDLKGTYDQNDLTISEKSVTKEKVEIRYCQIYGLKNKVIQDSINKELEQVALNFYKDEIKDLDEVINVSVNMWECANFANTLSFEVSYVAKIDDDDDGVYQGIKSLNYDLTTGKKITIDKLFTSDAPTEDILRKSAYYSFIQTRMEDSLSGNFMISDYGDIEEEIALFINRYKKGKITEFSYTPKVINIWYDENTNITIDMKEYGEYIAIYNRYLSEETIFEINNIGIKNLYTLTERVKNNCAYMNYEKGKNYFIDISVDFNEENENEFAKDLAQNKIKDIEKEIDKLKSYANRYTDRFYILNYNINIQTGEDTSTKQKITRYYEIGNSYEITVHDFEENIEPIIIKYNRQQDGVTSNYLYDFSEVLKSEPQKVVEYYNPETGEKVVI